MGELPLTDQDRIEHFDRLLIHVVGGEDVWHMLVSSHAGVSTRQIATMYATPESTVRTWLRRARAALRAVGLDADAIAPRAARQQAAITQ